MEEFSFIDSVKPAVHRQSSLIKGIGDDAAVVRNTAEDLVISVDTFAEGIHFTRTTMSLFDVGYKALAANISDLAAMGARPAFYLVSIAISEEWEMDDVQEIFKGMKALGDAFSMDLIGGDTVSANSLVISVTVMGYTEKDRACYRSTSKENDIVFVTGMLGDSAAGLHLLLHPELEHGDRSYFEKRHQRPSPRADFANRVASCMRVTLNDISDGVASEANEIAAASGVDLHLMFDQLPVHPGLSDFKESEKWILSGGEDFELIGTVASSDWPQIKKIAEETKVSITEIGKVCLKVAATGQVWIESGGQKKLLDKSGYNHFK